MKAEIGKRYRHYKNGKEYIVLMIVLHSDSHDEMVVYEGQYDSPEFGNLPRWTRSREDFEEKVLYEGVEVDRFTLIS